MLRSVVKAMIRRLTALGLGAGLMYFLDPDCGRRRRALVRDQLDRALHDVEDAIEVTARDVSNRLTGLACEFRSLASRDDASDAVIEARVRSKLGRVVSHPHSIDVTVRNGAVTLSGPILASEVDQLLGAMAEVRGVCEVENRLELHEHPGDHPALQGACRREGERPEILQENWSPTMRLVAVSIGALPILSLARLTGLGSVIPLSLGVALLARTEQRGANRRRGRRRSQSRGSHASWSDRRSTTPLSQGMGI